ncbi:MAG: hypothetical protein ACI4JY_08510 [Oscillospiraceae bacterium]
MQLLSYIMYLIPPAVLIMFIVALVLFLQAPKGSPKRRSRKVFMIVAAVLCAVIYGAILAFVIIMMSAIKYM